MSYTSVATVSQVASLLFFIAMFIGVIIYVFWPGNRQKFDEVQRKALDLGPENKRSGGL
ncbi:MAG TPA: cbb3-type cytochrome c oxidase subunit 3 [Hyphomicrobiaceae bacterium]|nr:cbb3-type cytochrome c oxidase subunit 3 [Hyphomicrobiaceae bacterium]